MLIAYYMSSTAKFIFIMRTDPVLESVPVSRDDRIDDKTPRSSKKKKKNSGPYGHIPIASSCSANNLETLVSDLEVRLMLVSSEKQCDSSLACSRMDVCLGKRAEGGRGAGGPLIAGFDLP